jgi:two-component system sensor histidine kinase RpfC
MLDKFKNIDFKNDDELSQALARIIISPILLFITAGLIYFGQYDDTFTLFVMAGHSLYSCFIFFNTLRKSGNYPIRRVLNIIADLGAVTLVIYACDTSAIFLYPVMLWVIVGNGVRFGVKYLYASLAFGVVFFGLATYLNKEWHSHPELSISL